MTIMSVDELNFKHTSVLHVELIFKNLACLWTLPQEIYVLHNHVLMTVIYMSYSKLHDTNNLEQCLHLYAYLMLVFFIAFIPMVFMTVITDQIRLSGDNHANNYNHTHVINILLMTKSKMLTCTVA